MGIPSVYRKSGEPATITYDFIDVLNSLGYVNYYGINHTDWCKLMREPIPSQVPIIKWTTNNGTTWTLQSNKNWDLDFNVPQIVKGDLFTSATFDRASGDDTMQLRMDLIISKVDAALNVIEIARISGAAVNWAGSTTGCNRVITKVNIPVTKIKSGEKLRVNTQVLDVHGGTISSEIRYFWCDGASRGTSIYNQNEPYATYGSLGYKNTTDLKVSVPFKLDI